MNHCLLKAVTMAQAGGLCCDEIKAISGAWQSELSLRDSDPGQS
jgi:hypothetical protein